MLLILNGRQPMGLKTTCAILAVLLAGALLPGRSAISEKDRLEAATGALLRRGLTASQRYPAFTAAQLTGSTPTGPSWNFWIRWFSPSET